MVSFVDGAGGGATDRRRRAGDVRSTLLDRQEDPLLDRSGAARLRPSMAGRARLFEAVRPGQGSDRRDGRCDRRTRRGRGGREVVVVVARRRVGPMVVRRCALDVAVVGGGGRCRGQVLKARGVAVQERPREEPQRESDRCDATTRL